jgi:biopolymer transport protein ExbD
MFGKHRRKGEEPVQPDLPITPMLDMSFQLMAFFIFTFHPVPAEGQIAMSLPKEDNSSSATAIAIPSPTDEKPVSYVVRVEAASNGTIAALSILEKGGAATEPESLGADLAKYREAITRRYEEQRKRYEELRKLDPGMTWTPPKLTLELDDALLQEYVVGLLDAAVGAGFTDVAPVPADPKKR